HASLPVLWMHEVQPTGAICGTRGSSRIFVKSIADVIPGPIRLPAENDVWSCVHNRIQFLILPGELTVQLLQGFCSPFQFRGALGNTLLQSSIEGFQLVGLAMEL